MKDEAYKILKENVNYHWWTVSRDRILSEFIKSLEIPCEGNILQLGTGTGNFLSNLGFTDKFGIDIYKYPEPYNYFTFIQADVNELPLKENKIDLLLMVDLLEHIEDDKRLIKDCFRILRKNGKMIIFVPSLQVLWSDWDEINMHFRRYTSGQLEKLIENCSAKYKVLKKSYVNFFLLPSILIIRIIQKMIKRVRSSYNSSAVRPPHMIINSIFRFIFSSEMLFLKYLDFPIGTSYILILEKR